MTNKTIKELEIAYGVVVKDIKVDPNTNITVEEFEELILTGKTVGVNHEDRVNFLQDNGYKVTRENLIDPELSAKPLVEG